MAGKPVPWGVIAAGVLIQGGSGCGGCPSHVPEGPATPTMSWTQGDHTTHEGAVKLAHLDDGRLSIELDATDGPTLVLIVPEHTGSFDLAKLMADAAVVTVRGVATSAKSGSIELKTVSGRTASGSFNLAFEDPAMGALTGSFNAY